MPLLVKVNSRIYWIKDAQLRWCRFVYDLNILVDVFYVISESSENLSALKHVENELVDQVV